MLIKIKYQTWRGFDDSFYLDLNKIEDRENLIGLLFSMTPTITNYEEVYENILQGNDYYWSSERKWKDQSKNYLSIKHNPPEKLIT